MLLPGDIRASAVRTLSVEGVGELTLIRKIGREARFPWKPFERFEWTGRTASGAEFSLDSVASADDDPEEHVLDRMRRMLTRIPDIRSQVAKLMLESVKDWTVTPPASEEAFAAVLKFDGANYLKDNDPSGDMLEVYFIADEDLFGDHSIQCAIDHEGRVTSTDLVG